MGSVEPSGGEGMRTLLLCVVLALAPGLATAGQLPTETDLRAAYCARVLAEQVGMLQSLRDALAPGRQEEGLEAPVRDARAKHTRVLAYLEPRIPYLELAPLNAAIEQAKADGEALLAEAKASPCQQKPLDELVACVRSRPLSDAGRKAKVCQDLSWLPF